MGEKRGNILEPHVTSVYFVSIVTQHSKRGLWFLAEKKSDELWKIYKHRFKIARAHTKRYNCRNSRRKCRHYGGVRGTDFLTYDIDSSAAVLIAIYLMIIVIRLTPAEYLFIYFFSYPHSTYNSISVSEPSIEVHSWLFVRASSKSCLVVQCLVSVHEVYTTQYNLWNVSVFRLVSYV